MSIPDIIKLFPEIEPGSFSFLPVLDRFHEGVIITDARGMVLYMNDHQKKIDDLMGGKVIGKNVSALYSVDDDLSPVMRCIKTGTPIDSQACFYRTHLGKVVNSVHNVFPLLTSDKLIGTICFIRAYNIIEQSLKSFLHPEDTQKTDGTVSIVSGSAEKKQLTNGTRFTFDDIIGAEPEFLKTIEATRLASDSPSPVMLFGNTGTGKELLAQSIHNHSRRRNQNYVAINCAAIPETLLEGILFGTSRGAFTGAMEKAGLFEKASGGTLFLDEINSMSVGLQAKLLRTLQERKVRRVGSLKEISLDLKIISSVNEDPHQAIERGTFRADLLYRLAVVFVRIPSLKQRKGDLGILIRHFLEKYNRRLNKKVTAISPDVMALFSSYDWPGNVRELEHIIEGAMNLVKDATVIRTEHLAVHIGELPTVAPASIPARQFTDHPAETAMDAPPPPAPPTPAPAPGEGLSDSRDTHEIKVIRQALKSSRGNAAQAARRLKMSPQLLHYKLKKYRIDGKSFKPMISME
jgi:arginine utilization regulatory protein